METPPTAPGTEPSSPPPPQSAPGGISDQQWIVFLHLSAFAGLVLPSFGNILGPLIIWLVKKSESAAIDAAGKDVLNFQISWTIWMFVSIAVAVAGSCLMFPVVIPFGLLIAWVVFVILGAVKAGNGETYKFPLTIKIL